MFELCLFVYCFMALAVICEEHLVVSLETLCVRWLIREGAPHTRAGVALAPTAIPPHLL